MEKSLAASLRIRDVRAHRRRTSAKAALFRKLAQTRYCLGSGAEAGMS
jgi:hypothetical protein